MQAVTVQCQKALHLLAYPNMGEFIQILGLPPNIQKLQITGCNWRTVELLGNFLGDVRRKCSELEEVVCIWDVSASEEIRG